MPVTAHPESEEASMDSVAEYDASKRAEREPRRWSAPLLRNRRAVVITVDDSKLRSACFPESSATTTRLPSRTNATGRGTIDPSQQAVLNLYFVHPDDLVGEFRHDLKRLEIAPGQDSEIKFVLR